MPSFRKKKENKVDYTLILSVLLLLIIGFLSVYVSVGNDYPDRVQTILLQQVMWLGLGILIAFIVMFFTTAFLWKVTPVLYLLGLGLMFLPLIYYSPALVAATGAKNWITIGSMTLFQPSEFLKLSYILMLARVTVAFQTKYPNQTLKQEWGLLGLYLLVTIPVMVLLAMQKDLGTSLVFLAILSGVVLVSGISWRIILPILSMILSFISGFLFIFIRPGGKEFFFKLGMDTYQINRMSAWLNPFDFADSIAYQQTQGMIAIGSGGLAGKGFNVIDLSVPVRESDMIFTVVAENTGFIGSIVVISLYLILIYRMLKVTMKSNNRFYTYISTGFTMMIFFHILENIGASLGVLPLTGIPLPFISQGGSSLISNLIGVGLVLSISYQYQVNAIKEYN